MVVVSQEEYKSFDGKANRESTSEASSLSSDKAIIAGLIGTRVVSSLFTIFFLPSSLTNGFSSGFEFDIRLETTFEEIADLKLVVFGENALTASEVVITSAKNVFLMSITVYNLILRITSILFFLGKQTLIAVNTLKVINNFKACQ